MNTKEMIAVMQAYEDGKQIEYKSNVNGWVSVENPNWDWVNRIYRIKPTKKPVQLSVLIDSGIDCEFSDDGFDHIDLAKLVELFDDKGPYNYQAIMNDGLRPNFKHCRPRMNHIHAWQGGICKLPKGVEVKVQLRSGEWVKESEGVWKHLGVTYDIIAFEVIGLADGYCYPWQIDEVIDGN